MSSSTAVSVERTGKRHPAGVTLGALALGFVMATLDATVVNIAGPGISAGLHLSLSGLTWAIDGYTLTFASLLLLSGSLANRVGAKRMYLAGLAVFAIASAVCGFAVSGGMLVGARMLQGVGAGMFMPSSLSLLVFSFPEPGRRARMLGLWAAIVSISAGLGPVVGGILVDTLGWRSIFMVNIPIGLAGFLLAQRIVSAPPAIPVRVTVLSHAVGILTLAAVCFTLIEGPVYGWGSAPIIGSAVFALCAATVFVLRERRAVLPIIPRELLRDRVFTASNAIGFLINFGCFGGIFLLGLFFQNARGARPFTAGLELLPIMGIFLIGNLIFARIGDRVSARRVMLIGLPAGALGAVSLTLLSPGTPYWLIVVVMGVVHLGVGISVPAMTTGLMSAAGPSHANIAGASLNANRQMGTLVGVAVAGALFAIAGWYGGAADDFGVMAGCYVLAALLAWRFIR
ncbi:MFS transporter [Nocardia sp. NPDC020380]|uniref:MFS transporter n=1 Tax=Nocardia sp. NPDC020380 TaxID=3364309 RepID=UPI0037BD3BF4